MVVVLQYVCIILSFQNMKLQAMLLVQTYNLLNEVLMKMLVCQKRDLILRTDCRNLVFLLYMELIWRLIFFCKKDCVFVSTFFSNCTKYCTNKYVCIYMGVYIENI